MAIDTWRLSAIVNELTEKSETFNPSLAQELFDALPEERWPRIKTDINTTTTTPSVMGEAGAGQTPFEETTEKNIRLGYSKGTYAGKWRVTKTKNTVVIEPKFHNNDKEFYQLIFGKRGEIKFNISKYYTIHFIIMLSFVRMVPWKTMQKVHDA